MPTEKAFAERRALGRKANPAPGTRYVWRDLDIVHAKRDTEPEAWPYQCYCGYRYASSKVLKRHCTHANVHSQIEGLHKPLKATR